MAPFKKIEDFLQGPGSLLYTLLKKHQAISTINHAIKTMLPSDLAQACTAINLREGCVTLGCDSAEQLTLLRFESIRLLQELRKIKTLEHLARVRYKVMPKVTHPQKTRSKKTDLSYQSAQHIRQFAEQTQDETLKKIFHRLANRVTKKS